jgi:hypothetical protein
MLIDGIEIVKQKRNNTCIVFKMGNLLVEKQQSNNFRNFAAKK